MSLIMPLSFSYFEPSAALDIGEGFLSSLVSSCVLRSYFPMRYFIVLSLNRNSAFKIRLDNVCDLIAAFTYLSLIWALTGARKTQISLIHLSNWLVCFCLISGCLALAIVYNAVQGHINP